MWDANKGQKSRITLIYSLRNWVDGKAVCQEKKWWRVVLRGRKEEKRDAIEVGMSHNNINKMFLNISLPFSFHSLYLSILCK